MGETDLLEQRMSAFEKFMDKQEDNNKRMWERIDQQSKEMVRIQVLMEGISKTLEEVKAALNNINKDGTKDSSKWEQFYAKAFWSLSGAVVTYFIYKLKG